MPKFLSSLGTARKALVAVAGFAAQLVALGVVHGTVLHYVQGALAGLAAIGVYVVPNTKPAAKPAAAAAPAAPAAK